MPKIEVRPTTFDDLEAIVELKHDFLTTHVWQMERLIENGQVSINFREIRLPREVEVVYPNFGKIQMDGWLEQATTLTALHNNRPVGYMRIEEQADTNTAWIKDVVIAEDIRRKGVASALILAAQEWAVQKSLRWLIVDMQSKNYPGIKLALKLGFEFSGYHDHYYANQDIALFFAKYLK